MDNKNEVQVQDDQRQDDLREQIKSKLQEVRIQAMTTGAQTMMQLISSRIDKFENEPGKHSCADYKRLVKSIKKMCAIKNEGAGSDEQGSEDSN